MRPRSALPLLAVAFATGAAACDCKTFSVQERTRLSHAVFTARVVDSQPLKKVRLAVVDTFKGRLASEITISIAPNDCDYLLPPVETRVGDEFLVFSSLDAGVASVSRCLGSAPLAQAARDLTYLRSRRR